MPGYEEEKEYSYTLKNVNMIQSMGESGGNSSSYSNSGSKKNSATKINK